MSTLIKRFVTTGLIILSAARLQAQPLPLDKSIRSGKLSNGFTYFVRKNTEPRKRATLYLVVKAGSILEDENQRGLAHFMEHMSFNGTRHFPKNELVQYLQKSGVRFGADLNAYTGFDETVYQLPIPTDDPALFRNGLQIMRDWAGEATLEMAEVDKERGVVLEEKRLNKGAGERLQEKLLPFVFNRSRYADRLPIGTEQVLKNFTHSDIASFYKDWYRPDLEALIVVGDVDMNAVEQQIKHLFAGLKNPAKPRARTAWKAPLLHRNRFIAATDAEVGQTSMEISFKTSASAQGSRAQYKAALLNNLCSQLLAGRLSDLSKAPGAPVIGTQGGYQPVIKGIDALTVEFTAKKGQLAAGFAYVYGSLLQIRKYGFTAAEIARTKTAYRNQLKALLREKDRQNSTALADELKRHFLDNEPAPGIACETRLVEALLPELTQTLINQKIAALLTPGNRDIILTGPSDLPAEHTVNSWITTAEQLPVKPYKEASGSKELLSRQPQPGRIVAETQHAALGLTEWTLSNGAKVFIKPTTFKNDEVYLHAFSAGGSSLYSNTDFESANAAAGIIDASGLGSHDATALPKLLSGKKVGLTPYISERTEGIDGQCAKADLNTELELLYGYFTEPRKDTAMFSSIMTRSAEMIAARYTNPGAVFQDSISAVLGNDHPRRTGPSFQKLQQISLNRSLEIYRERFADAGDFTFVLTGSLNLQALRPLVERYIAALPAGGNKEAAKDLGIRAPSGDITKKVYAGKEDKASVMLLFHGTFTFSPEESLKLTALKDVIGFRMIERLRETEGGAYAPSVSFRRDHGTDDRYELTIYFGCAPANTDKLIAAALEEIEKIKTDGPTDEDLQKFKAEQARTLETNLQDNRYWLSYLTTKLQYGEDISAITGQAARIKVMTAKDIQNAARRYCGKDLIRFLWLPEKAAAK